MPDSTDRAARGNLRRAPADPVHEPENPLPRRPAGAIGDACLTVATTPRPWNYPLVELSSDLHQNFEFPISSGVGGGPCPSGQAPFSPGAEDGSVNSNAGSYSPFYLHLTRNDTEEEITSYSALLPKGLTGKIAGMPFCPDAALAAAARETGVGELEHPHCPAASEIGHTVAGYGLGGVLTYAPGKLYLDGSLPWRASLDHGG